MKKYEKEVQQAFLNNEEAVIKRLKQVYSVAQKDIEKKTQDLQDEINRLGTMAKLSVDADEKAKLLSMQQSKIYQKQYQDAMKKQIDSILDNMQVEEFKTVSEYLRKCYEEGFTGAMYSLQQQGIPLCFPLDQEAIVRAVQIDSKISNGLYTRLGEDVAVLKKKIAAQVSRGISTGMSFAQVAQQLAGYTNIGFNNAVRIARTEGHRIQVQSSMDACYKAKDKGADIVKQWDSTLDKRTRKSHQKVDGEIQELDEPFSNGLMFPGDPSGAAAEVINCRCALLQRARWSVGDKFTKRNNFTKQLETFEKPEDYAEFKNAFFSKENKQYMNYVKTLEDRYKTKDWTKIIDYMTESEYDHYFKLLSNNPIYNGKAHLEKSGKSGKIEAEKISDECKVIVDALKNDGVEYRAVKMHETPLTENEIISALAGGDLTQGSCASLGLAYCGQKGGMNVLDYRDGKSRNFFATKYWLEKIADLPGITAFKETARSSITAGNRLLKYVEAGKEYYLVSGRHAAIVRKTKEGVLQYLELQSARNSGWHNFDGNPRSTLKYRFGEYKGWDLTDYMIEVDSIKNSPDLKNLLGYINTAENEQRKGKYGTIK